MRHVKSGANHKLVACLNREEMQVHVPINDMPEMGWPLNAIMKNKSSILE